jgi:DNA-binding FadR family transcriptional regulator
MEQLAAGPSSPATERLFHEADLAFHSVLIQAARNRALASLVGRIHRALLTARFPAAPLDLRRQRTLPEHRRVLDAILAGDARAARRAMGLHLETVAGYLHDYAAQHADGASAEATELRS